MWGNGIGKALDLLVYLAITGVVLTIACTGYGGYKIYDYYANGEVITSDHRIEPTIRLKTDGKVIDTLYIYKTE